MRHPIRGDKDVGRKTYEAICKKIQRFYGVSDAEEYFRRKKKAIADRCEHDEFGWAKFASLKEWHEAKSIAEKYGPTENRAD